MPSPVELILKKRNGAALSEAELTLLVNGLLSGEVTDYQMSAWLMATYFRGLNDAETVALTRAMLHSGKILDLKSVVLPKVDKHSTGGVGDKISLCLAPLVAACGVCVPMVSGRGLAHTGGTLDKLEAIPGFQVQLSAARFERIARDVGTVIMGQTEHIAPADRRIYALRDVTGTVDSVPLIVASILSKKLAEGIDGLVLDVKVGSGAFMKDLPAARTLAKALVRVGKLFGKRVVALLTDMSSPIGRTIGNALETREAIEVLRNAGPEDTRELTLALGSEMLVLGGVTRSRSDARARLQRALADGSAFERFVRLVKAQGGDTRVLEDPSKLPRARATLALTASRAGVVARIDPLELGLCAVALGAGRRHAEDPVDAGAGIEILAPLGTRVKKGASLAILHGRTPALLRAELPRAARAFQIGRSAPAKVSRVLGRI